jgi:Tfp pilus assembly protein PilN
MSLAFLTKPIGGSKNKDAGDSTGVSPEKNRPAKPGPTRGSGASAVVGGPPRVDLMPPEIRVKRAQLQFRRKLRLGLVAVFIIVVVACGGTWAMGSVAQANLLAAQSQRQQLIVQQGKYADVTTTKASIALVQAGQKVGDSTEIDWQAYLTKLQATLPSGVALTAVAIDSATPLKQYAPATVPLQGDRIATLTFTASSATLPSIPDWLDGLATLPGFADATPGDVSLADAGGYTASVTMHINTKAFANRFDKKAAAANTDSGASTGGN